MADLNKLQVLSLVSKLTNEISNHIGIEDKSLAEYIVDIHEKVVRESEEKVLSRFEKKLHEVGAEFPKSVVEHINGLIFRMHPDLKKKGGDNGSENRAGSLNGLAIRDSIQMDSKTYSQEFKSRRDLLDDEIDRMTKLSGRKEPNYVRDRSQSPRLGRSRSPPNQRAPPWRRERRLRSPSPKRPIDHEASPPKFHDEQYPIVGKTYTARIDKVTNYGAFASIQGFSNISGLIHISKMADRHVDHPSDLVERDDIVKVKVVRIENNRISLSMRDADELNDRGRDRDKRENGRKRLTSPERWELRQLIASGAISAADYPELQAETNGNEQESDGEPIEMEEDVDIELNEEEPPFLAGQTHQSLELSPIRVVKAPDGSLNRAAMTGASYAKERREKRQEEARMKEKEEKSRDRDVRSMADPLAPVREDAGENTNEDLSYSTETHALSWKKTGKQTFGKRSDLPIDVQRKSLPVYQLREQVIQAVRDNQILIVVGDTGSGKTTQITQYLNEEGFTSHGLKIGCTQPRRVAAVSVAKRVAEEMGTKVGHEVGYTIRFEDCTGPGTKIKYMTDGMLQREALIDPDMSQYSVIMLDEAHERTIATDVLFALLKKAAKRRPDLKLIVTSATLDSEKFSKYFWNCPILFIPGRTFPVSIEYVREPEMDYLDATLSTIIEIHLSEPVPGDILVFLTGQEEIDTSCEALEERMKRLKQTMNDVSDLIILPVYSALPSEMQSRIFEPAPLNARKVILATNIAETSVTIDGIYYVVDPGFVKINAYDPKLGMDSLIISPISQAQANQRAGRAGRTGPGKCFRLYTQSAYEKEMLPNTIPEIQRQNLSNSILMLKAMGINDLLHFDFMDPPPTNTMLSALEELYQLSALDDEGLLTRLGRRMADFPMEPAMSKVLLTSVDARCSEEMLTIVAMLSVQTIFYRPNDRKNQADQKHAKFKDSSGDHITLLNVYNDWQRSDYSRQWCTTNFIQERSLKRARDVRKQLVQIMKDRHKYRLESCGNKTENVRKALCSGYFRNSARKDPQEGYKTLVESTPVFMHPSSSLFFKPAEYVIYHTLLLTSREYMNCVTTIDPKWLVEAAPHFFKVASAHQLSKRKKNEKIEPLKSRFSDQNSWRLSAQKKIIQSAQRSGFG